MLRLIFVLCYLLMSNCYAQDTDEDLLYTSSEEEITKRIEYLSQQAQQKEDKLAELAKKLSTNSPSLNEKGYYNSSYDKFKKLTTYSWRESALNPIRKGFYIFKSDNGQVAYNISFYHSWDYSNYTNCHGVLWLVDDKPFQPLISEYDWRNMNDFFWFTLSYSQMQKLANASKVEVQICNTEFAFSDEDKLGIKQILDNYQQSK